MRSSPYPPISARCLVLLLLISVCGAHAERLPSTFFTASDGLPHWDVRRVLADSRGFVWFSTRRGLSRFDGQRFLTYGVSEGLPIPSVNDFLETSRGEYWVATNGGGACRLNIVATGNTGRDDSRIADCAKFETPEAGRVNRLYEDRSGRIWAGTDGGVFLVVGTAGQVKFERVELGLPDRSDRAVQVWEFAADPQGALWIATSAGLARRIDDSQTIHYRIQPLRGADHVYALLVDDHNRIWIGHGTGLIVFCYDEPASTDSARVRQLRMKPASNSRTRKLPAVPGEAIRFTTADGLTGESVLALHRASDRTIWIGTSQGLSRFEGETLTGVSTIHGLLHVTAIAEDQARHIWAVGDGGAVRLARTGFVRYTKADGLTSDIVRSVFEDDNGRLRVVTWQQVVHRFDGTRFNAVRPNLSKDRRALETAVPVPLRDRGGEWWVPGEAGLYRFPRVSTDEQLAHVRPKAVYSSRDGLAGDDIFSLFEDSRGDIWIARRSPTRVVLTRWDRASETFHRYTDSDGLPPFQRPITFGEDRTGSVWVGFFGGGVARYRNGRFTLFGSADGAPPGSIASIHADAAGRLWIGSGGGGVTRVDDLDVARPRFVRYTTAEGLSSDSILTITEDHSGRIYFGMFSGIDRLDPRSGHVRHYALPDELAGSEVDVSFCDRSGRLWFGTSRGLVSLIAGADNPGPPPSILIGGLRVSGAIYPVSGLGEAVIPEIELQAHEKQVQVDFFSIGTVSPVRYQYMLEGADRGWSEPTDQRSVTFASLSPGQYRFLVRAIAADGLTSSPASVALHIHPPLWLRWWFLTGAAFVVALAAYALHRLRLVRLVELERVRTRIATDLHDDIGSSLTQIAILSEVAERGMKQPDPAVAEPISRVSLISRELVDSMSEIVWAINPRNDRLQDLVSRMRRFAVDMLTGRQIALRFQPPEAGQDVAIDTDLRRQMFLIFKEAVHNAVRHSGSTEIHVEISPQNRRLVMRVYDNGRGFDRGESNNGHGLGSMEARARALGGRLEIVSEAGRGTTVRVDAPLARTAGRKAS